MTTILSEKNKKEIKRQYFFGFFSKMVLSLIVLSFILLILEGTVYYMVEFEKRVLEEEYSTVSSTERTELINQYREDIKSAKEIVEIFDVNKVDKVEVLDFVFDKRTEGVEINSVSIEKGETAIFVGVGGIASTRDTLSGFREILSESKRTSSVDLPVSSFTKTFDIPFTITFVFNKNEEGE
jgi:hypothetical protein